MQKKNYLLILFLFISVFYSCTDNPLDIDTSSISLTLKIDRFEKDLFLQNNSPDATKIKLLASNYEPFFSDFTQEIINIGNLQHQNFQYQLNSFINDSYVKKIYDDVENQYADFSIYEAELTEAFKHYNYYFPAKKTPRIITYMSGLNYAIATGEDYLAIGLDMFLGKDYEPYVQLQLPEYKRNVMTKDYLISSVLLGWIATEYEMKETQPNLLAEMIHQGKIIYMLDALIPNEKNYKKMSYTETQYNWCNKNQKQIWFYLMDNKLLFSKENAQIIKFMGEAPFTSGFPEGSPGRIGHWVGWEIVKAYMKQNPTTTIAELMQLTNAQEILTKSNYKPN